MTKLYKNQSYALVFFPMLSKTRLTGSFCRPVSHLVQFELRILQKKTFNY